MNIVVISPHLDDGVLSLGGTMSRMVREGHSVRLVTVFAGDPGCAAPPSFWNRHRNAESAAEVTVQRREEDHRAADALGVQPVWLPFDDDAQLARRDPDEIWGALAPSLGDADRVFLPGWPLSHPDHRYATLLTLRRCDEFVPIRFYCELPYAHHPVPLVKGVLRGRTDASLADMTTNVVNWSRSRLAPTDLAAKIRSLECYSGEVSALGWSLPIKRRQRFQLAFEHIGQS